MKIAFYSHNIDFAGTWRTHERKAEYIQNQDDFDVYVFYSPNVENNRLEESKKILTNCKFVPFERTLEKFDASSGYNPISCNIRQIVNDLKIDIFHFTRSGYFEWPFNVRMCPIQIETNIFGYKDNSSFLDGSIFITKRFDIAESNVKKLIHCPIPEPGTKFDSIESLRSDLHIDQECLVLGRSGRPANFDPIALNAFALFKKEFKAPVKYVIMGGCEQAKNEVLQLGLKDDVIFIDCTNDDEYIERFHKTIDIFAHYRSDGETFGTAIGQAMMYSIPVITHYAGQNSQVDTVAGGGFSVASVNEYARALLILSNNSNRSSIGLKAKDHAMTHYAQNKIGSQVKEFYYDVAASKGF